MHWQGLKWQRHSLTFNPSSDIVIPQSGKWKWKWCLLSHARLFTAPWTIESMEFSRPEYWSGYPFPSPGDLPNPGIELRPPTQIFLPGEPQGSPKILEWVAYPFSSGSSQLRSQTGVSCIAGRFFTNWATREAHSQVVSPNTKLSWGEKGLYLTSGIPTPDVSTEKMSPHSVWFWKSKGIPTRRVCIAESRDSIFNCLSHQGSPRIHS